MDAVEEDNEREVEISTVGSGQVEELVDYLDRVAMRVTLSGTQLGTFQGIDPTDNAVEIQSMVFTRIEDRRIAERWLSLDMLGLVRQLGPTTETRLSVA